MSYLDKIHALDADAEGLESLYQDAVKSGTDASFIESINAAYNAEPINLLYAAWFHRLAHIADKTKGLVIAWAWAIPLALLNGLLFWWLSDEEKFVVEMTNRVDGSTYDFMPALLLFAAPIAAAFVMFYLAAAGRKCWGWVLAVGVVLAAATAYVFWVYPQTGSRPFQEQYLTLAAIHLPLLAWAGVGAFLVFDQRDPKNRFAFLIKSLEVFIMGGLYVIAGGLFTAITVGLFSALGIEFPGLIERLFFAGGGGLIPVVAVAVLYNPTVPPASQAFDDGLSKLVALLMRVMLPLSLLVLLVYIGFIPFNFRQPFENRDVLIIYNAMLFAVVALLVGATPVHLADLSPRLQIWLRRGIVVVAALALLVSIYAFAAIVYRTAIDKLTPNRLTFMGWNLVNIGLLFLLLGLLARAKSEEWLQRLYRTFSAGTVGYTIWALTVILAVPWLFSSDQGDIEALPVSVQNIAFEEADPILLKCWTAPHIYLLEDGEKRWIKDIETFNDRGYIWGDVEFIPCDDLRAVPDGVPIPKDAGSPPQP